MKLLKCGFHDGEYNYCTSNQKLPRKKKKELKKLYNKVGGYYAPLFGCEFDKCSQVSIYEDLKTFLIKGNKLLKYKYALDYVFSNTEETSYINEKGVLCFSWEDYNGLYTYTGETPFYYNKKDAGDTWSFEEVESLIYNLTKKEFPKEIVSDITLLKYINNFLKQL